MKYLHNVSSLITRAISAIPYGLILEPCQVKDSRALIIKRTELQKVSDMERLAADWTKIGGDFRNNQPRCKEPGNG